MESLFRRSILTFIKACSLIVITISAAHGETPENAKQLAQREVCTLTLTHADSFATRVSRILEEFVARTVNRGLKHEFSVEEFDRQLEKIEAGSSVGKLDSFEKIAAFYSHSIGRHWNLHAGNSDPQSVFRNDLLFQKLKLTLLMRPSLKSGRLSPLQNHLIIDLLMQPDDPVRLGLIETLSREKVRIKSEDYLQKKFTLAVAKGKAFESLKRLDSSRENSLLERTIVLMSDTRFNFVLNQVFNVMALKSGFFFPSHTKSLNFSALEIEKAIREGTDAISPLLLSRFSDRARNELISEVSSQWAIRLATITAVLVTASSIIELQESELKGLEELLLESEKARLAPPQEQLFQLWIEQEEKRLGSPIDTTSSQYRAARMLFLENRVDD
jgi:hypothetical protein